MIRERNDYRVLIGKTENRIPLGIPVGR